MNNQFHNVEHNTEAWDKLRLGRFTASIFKDLFMGKQTAGYKKAIYAPVYERLTGEKPNDFQSDYMERGHEIEPVAAIHYAELKGVELQPGGFWTVGDWIGASPDRLVGDDGLLEIKSPAWNTMFDYLLKQSLPNIYHWQVVGQLYVTGREWCDFIAYHPKLKPLIIRIERDDREIAKLKEVLDEAIHKSQDILRRLS